MMRSAMIIDCHGHYTTAPPQLGAYRDAQKAALALDPDHVGERPVPAADLPLAQAPPAVGFDDVTYGYVP